MCCSLVNLPSNLIQGFPFLFSQFLLIGKNYVLMPVMPPKTVVLWLLKPAGRPASSIDGATAQLK
jgi:hypothetical protein